jgi:hypothetical protein
VRYALPFAPWPVVHRRELHHPGPAVLNRAIDQLVAEERWHELPDDCWLAADRQLLDRL